VYAFDGDVLVYGEIVLESYPPQYQSMLLGGVLEMLSSRRRPAGSWSESATTCPC
jgi:hypothetical protein